MHFTSTGFIFFVPPAQHTQVVLLPSRNGSDYNPTRVGPEKFKAKNIKT